MNYYVYILGSYDSVFVGPFEDRKAGYEFKEQVILKTYGDAWLHTEETFEYEQDQYGEIPVYAPEDYLLEDLEAGYETPGEFLTA